VKVRRDSQTRGVRVVHEPGRLLSSLARAEEGGDSTGCAVAQLHEDGAARCAFFGSPYHPHAGTEDTIHGLDDRQVSGVERCHLLPLPMLSVLQSN
jgi:hypothetical protein